MTNAGGAGKARPKRIAFRQRNEVIDPAVVRARRIGLGINVATLAAYLGVNASIIARIEGGGRQDKLDLAFLADLAATLGVAIADLLPARHASAHPNDADPDGAIPDDADPDDADPDDVEHVAAEGNGDADCARVGAILMAASAWVNIDELAEHLSWSRQRVLFAIDECEREAPGMGLCIAWLAEDAVRLVADVGGSAHTRMHPSKLGEERGLDLDEHRVLFRLAHDHSRKSDFVARESKESRHRLGLLGLTTFEAERHLPTLSLSETARFNLCLDELEDDGAGSNRKERESSSK